MASSIINSDDGVVSGTSGLKTTGGDDGVLVFQSKGTETARINTDSQIVAAAGTASLPALTTTGDVNTGIFFPAADTIGVGVGGSEAVRVTSTKQLLVTNNGASAQGSIRINNQSFTGSTSTGPHIFGYEGSNELWWIGSFDQSGVYGNRFVLNGYNGTEIRSSGGLAATFNTSGNLAFPSGQGIDFSASAGGSASSSILDDYEEGTWTPTLPNGGTLTVTSARYVKIGQQVTVSCFLTSVAPTNNASDFLIGGLPYANAGYSPSVYTGGSFAYVGDSNLSGWLPITGANFSYIYFHIQGADARRSNANYVTAASGSQDNIILSITYFAAT